MDRIDQSGGILLWGRAIPIDAPLSTFGTVLEGNIAVFGTGSKPDNPMYYVGIACYSHKGQGVNAFNAPVTMWVYVSPCSVARPR